MKSGRGVSDRLSDRWGRVGRLARWWRAFSARRREREDELFRTCREAAERAAWSGEGLDPLAELRRLAGEPNVVPFRRRRESRLQLENGWKLRSARSFRSLVIAS
jgi:hypothetical protein